MSHQVYAMESSHKTPMCGVQRAPRHGGTSPYQEGDTPGREFLLGILGDQYPLLGLLARALCCRLW